MTSGHDTKNSFSEIALVLQTELVTILAQLSWWRIYVWIKKNGEKRVTKAYTGNKKLVSCLKRLLLPRLKNYLFSNIEVYLNPLKKIFLCENSVNSIKNGLNLEKTLFSKLSTEIVSEKNEIFV